MEFTDFIINQNEHLNDTNWLDDSSYAKVYEYSDTNNNKYALKLMKLDTDEEDIN